MNTLHKKLTKSVAYLNNNKYAIAVSGGSDSLALLYLCAELTNKENFVVVHFDHAVRDESSIEAQFVEKTALELGFKFEKKTWTNQEKSLNIGNFYQSARHVRYQFFNDICKKYHLDGVLVAHSKTDLAETLLMRLGKGASLKGVSIFEQGKKILGVKVYRPLLEFNRKELQNYLTQKNINWKNDPSNLDLNKMRPRIRAILPKLEEIGISLTGFYKAVNYFNQASEAFDYYTKKELENFKTSDLGYHCINYNDFFNLPIEMQVRLVNYIIEFYNKDVIHLPRRKNIIELLTRLKLKQTVIEPLDEIFLEIMNEKLFFYVNDKCYKEKANLLNDNLIKLKSLDKKTKYNFVKNNNLQTLPITIRNRIVLDKSKDII